MFAPYRHVRKITMFGSARTLPSDPLYAQARDLAARAGRATTGRRSPAPARASWRPAWRAPGRDHSFGINIRLPFEQEANEFIVSDPKLVSMKYFFTRKLLLIKESDGYAVLPGRLRDPGRGVRAADPAADRQGHARAHRAARGARRQLLAFVGASG